MLKSNGNNVLFFSIMIIVFYKNKKNIIKIIKLTKKNIIIINCLFLSLFELFYLMQHFNYTSY